MQVLMTIAIALVVSASARSAEPPATSKPTEKPAQIPNAPTPLKLQAGDVRKYMMPREFADALNAPDLEENTIIVEGKRVQSPMNPERSAPGGLIARALRLFLPLGENAPRDLPREPADKVPQREFRWGP